MDFRQRRRVDPPGLRGNPTSLLRPDGALTDSTLTTGGRTDGTRTGPAGGDRATGDTARVGSAAQRLRDQRRPRHSGIFEALHRLDAGIDPADRVRLSAWIREQYSVEYGDIPLGFVALCHLGPPYVDHRLDLICSILDHFAPADPMPEPFGQARMLVRTGAYACVEVYGSGHLVPVLADGSAVTS